MGPKLQQISDYLGGGKKFLLGDCITIADFVMYVSLDWNSTLDPGCLAKFPNIDNYIKAMKSDAKIKAYLDSEKHCKNRCPPFPPGAKVMNK